MEIGISQSIGGRKKQLSIFINPVFVRSEKREGLVQFGCTVEDQFGRVDFKLLLTDLI